MSLKPSRRVESPPEPPTWGEAFAWERELLGTVLSDPSAYEAVRTLIGPGDFSSGLHERLFEALPKLKGPNGSTDLGAVHAALGDYAWDAEGGIDLWLAGLLAERVSGAEAVRQDVLTEAAGGAGVAAVAAQGQRHAPAHSLPPQ